MDPDLNLSAIYPDSTSLPNGSVIEQVIVICRHGQRTPMIQRFSSLFPKLWGFCSSDHIIKKDNQIMPGICYYGQLTDLGKIQMESLGAFITQYPMEFKNMFVRSTNIPRALETAQHVMNGLKRHSKIHVEYSDAEDSLYPPNSCNKLNELVQAFQSKFLKDNYTELQELSITFDYEGLSTHPLFDSLASWFAHQHTTPANIKKEDLAKFTHYAAIEHWSPYTTELGARLGIGRLLGDLTRYINGSSDFVLLSGHDSTLAPLLSAYGAFNTGNIFWPPFGSALFIERIKWNGGKFARMRFNDQIVHIPKCKSKEEGDGWCPLTTFLEITKAMTPVDFEKECAN
eukprot:NODE_744_length_4636_cov_0.275033.p2 type:complete len:343 gc:universal NODE_744_length_4636_cov_0.275033:4514-3486(-)